MIGNLLICINFIIFLDVCICFQNTGIIILKPKQFIITDKYCGQGLPKYYTPIIPPNLRRSRAIKASIRSEINSNSPKAKKWSFPTSRVRIFLSALLIIIPSLLIRRKVILLDVGISVLLISLIAIINTAKISVYEWTSKLKLLQKSVLKHSTPLTKKYFFKNENAADRVTLLGVFINIILSITKFFGGLACNSAVLVADAGHSLSDLFSDFITLWAVQISRLPADDDHPYGHGKFESVGSLFLSLTLLMTGLSVGSWSYEKLVTVLQTQKITLSTLFNFKNIAASAAGSSGTSVLLKVPTWPALVLAAVSIFSKEWLFRITKRVGEVMNSQILIANAWHHRSDAFSSILSLISIAFAMILPHKFLFADAAGGILVAGMICLTGLEILFESVKQLTDTAATSDDKLLLDITKIAESVAGVIGIKQLRSRSVGSGYIIDMAIATDTKLSATAAQSIAERVRWKVMQSFPGNELMEVSVKTRTTDVLCPLLSGRQRTIEDIEKDVKNIVQEFNVTIDVRKVVVHYINTLELSVEVLITRSAYCTEEPPLELRSFAESFREKILSEVPDIVQAEIHMVLADNSLQLSSS